MKHILLFAAAVAFCGVFAPEGWKVPESMLESAKESGLVLGEVCGTLVRERKTVLTITTGADYSDEWNSLINRTIDDPDVYNFLLKILPGATVSYRKKQYKIPEKISDEKRKSCLEACIQLVAFRDSGLMEDVLRTLP